MKITKKLRDGAWLHDEAAEVAVPFEMVLSRGEVTVEYYGEAEAITDDFLRRFGQNEDRLTSGEAVDFALSRFEAFLGEYGFELSPDCGDIYVNYAITSVNGEISPEVKRIFGNEGYTDLTDTDIDGLTSGGYIIYGAVVDNNIVAVANTGVPIDEGTEKAVEIGVDTAEKYRRHGYGKACVTALCRELLALGHTPVYECAEGNKASTALAKSLGATELYRKFYIVGFRDSEE